jgi:hypothetical protein
MWIRSVVATAGGLAVVLAAVSCGQPITQPVISSGGLVGTWTTTWKDHPLTMCQDLDPDSPCSNPVFTKDAIRG